MALYHQHRPKAFAEVLGQDHIKTTVQNQLKNGRVGHAYLFSGLRGVGKTTTARILAKAVNCLEPLEGVACGTCTNCMLIDQHKTVDIIEIDAASHTGVENVRTNIIENAQFKPSTLKKKVFIIDEVHMLSTSAFNALLKIMEEPPEYILFILATTELHKVPDTIISRCQRFHFDRIPVETLITHIQYLAKAEGTTIDDQSAARIAALSQGCARDAVSLFEQVSVASDGNITKDQLGLILPNSSLQTVIQFIDGIASKNTDVAYQATKDLLLSNADPFFFANQCIESLRDILLIHIKQFSDVQKHMYSEEEYTALQSIATKLSALQTISLIDSISARKQMIKRSSIQILPLEMIIIEYCSDHQEISQKKNDKINIEKQNKQTGVALPQKETNTKPTTVPSKPLSSPPSSPSVPVQSASSSAEKIWPGFIELVENEKPSLVFILKMVNIISLEDDILTLEVPFSFHQDKITNTETKLFLEKQLSTLLHSATQLNVQVKGVQSIAIDEELNDLAKLIGGAVVA